ncbi:MAG TPA: acetyl-CoA C-acyltransferase, partial [Longimicrobiales bacterium]|nr:acetyl-CoA C-acyltransferase [Longimicrobiales bacterium]
MGTQGQSTDIVFLSGRRTPFGTFGGSLKGHSANDLGAVAATSALEEAGVVPEEIGHVIFGNALQTSADAIYHARHVGLQAGVPEEVPALTVNRLCGSGFQAIVSAAQEILLGQADVCLAGGAESMSQAPHVVRGARWGQLRLGEAGEFFEDLLWQALTDTRCDMSMAQTAEELAGRYEVLREEADRIAYESQQRAKRAWDEGRFDAEVVPMTLRTRKGELEFRTDEHMRPDTTMEALAGLRPYFRKDGLVTAGNASGIGDGAAATVVASGEWAERKGLKPLARLVSWGVAGVDPRIMGIGPAPSSRKALESAGLTLDDMDLVEVNEAFAPQVAAVARDLELDMEKTNVN